MALKSYVEHMAGKAPEFEASGVACSDFEREPVEVTVQKQRTVPRELEDGTVLDITEEYEAVEIQERNVRPCPGELLYLLPRQVHPQLANSARAVCSVCGWRGWI